MGPFKRLGQLEAQVASQERELLRLADAVKQLSDLTDSADLERLRASVLNALRALRRTQQAQDARSHPDEGNGQGDEIDRLLSIRRSMRGLLPGG